MKKLSRLPRLRCRRFTTESNKFLGFCGERLMVDEEILELLVGFANAQEAAAVDLKHKVAKLLGVKEAVAVKEETFMILKWEKQQGARLGEFQVALRSHNLPEKFQSALNILNKSNATIVVRYHGKGYTYSYWLYGKDRIYRQKLKKPRASP